MVKGLGQNATLDTKNKLPVDVMVEGQASKPQMIFRCHPIFHIQTKQIKFHWHLTGLSFNYQFDHPLYTCNLFQFGTRGIHVSQTFVYCTFTVTRILANHSYLRVGNLPLPTPPLSPPAGPRSLGTGTTWVTPMPIITGKSLFTVGLGLFNKTWKCHFNGSKPVLGCKITTLEPVFKMIPSYH